uniref:Uncharacterized protein n=1 Tax=Knipowitschia caucasica TaxID=637954 RepID=A0AAV2LDL9_KNICA
MKDDEGFVEARRCRPVVALRFLTTFSGCFGGIDTFKGTKAEREPPSSSDAADTSFSLRRCGRDSAPISALVTGVGVWKQLENQ